MKVTSTRNRITITASKSESHLIRLAIYSYCEKIQDISPGLAETIAKMGDQIPHTPAAFEVADWPALNQERGLLIDKNIAGTITSDEKGRLDQLQAYADRYLEVAAPRPLAIRAR